jgi:peptide deformylase
VHIFKLNESNHILNEDLTSIATSPADVAHLFGRLSSLCRVSNGLGVAANQLGIRLNFFFAAAGAKLEGRAVGQICIEPSWIPHPTGVESFMLGEGCLSMPGEVYSVSRWSTILATWTNTQGHVRRNVKLRGQAAQVFQHECDHLRGITLRECGTKLNTTN